MAAQGVRPLTLHHRISSNYHIFTGEDFTIISGAIKRIQNNQRDAKMSLLGSASSPFGVMPMFYDF